MIADVFVKRISNVTIMPQIIGWSEDVVLAHCKVILEEILRIVFLVKKVLDTVPLKQSREYNHGRVFLEDLVQTGGLLQLLHKFSGRRHI